jgi:poly(3-hydroxybutyrate) depolymerase
VAEASGAGEDALLAGEALLASQRIDEALGWLRRTGKDDALVAYYGGQCYLGKAERNAEAEAAQKKAGDLQRLIDEYTGPIHPTLPTPVPTPRT